MTDTIGWGDVDIDVALPRTRRVRGALLWLALLAVVAGVGLAPSARARLADSSAKWLGHVWAVAQSYDVVRTVTEGHALQRAAPGDAPRYARIVSLLDREEAARLRSLVREISRHHTWRSDVHEAALAAGRALAAEARDLETDAGRTAATFSSEIYLETPTQNSTQALQMRAQGLIDQLARRHHIRLPSHIPSTAVRLRSAAALLQAMDRVTDQPIDLRLAVSHDGTLDIWDLSTGKVRTDVASVSGPDFTQPVVRLGDGALFIADDGRPQLVTTDGRLLRLALPSRAQYLSAGDGSVWSVSGGLWRHYEGPSRPLGTAYRTPDGYADGSVAAAGDSIVIFKNSPYAGTQAALWTPSTGHLLLLPGCDAAITGSRDAVAYVGCDQITVSVMNLKNGRVRTVKTPAGTLVDEVGMALSPDGTRLAFRTGALNGDESKGSLLLLDTRTGHVKVLAQASTPLAWSPDGSTLVVSNDVGENLYPAPLAYWRDGMSNPEPIRILITGDTINALLLP